MYIKTIVRDIKSGKLTRDTDERGASGFWDLAAEYAAAIHKRLDYTPEIEKTQEALYNAFCSSRYANQSLAHNRFNRRYQRI